MSITVIRQNYIPNRPEYNCFINSRLQGYAGILECKKNEIIVRKVVPVWEGYYPLKEDTCKFGIIKDPRCYVRAPGADHPHVTMKNDFFYTIDLELP